MTDPPRPYAVVDIDGVVADVAHRLHHVARRPKDWEAFFAAAPDDGLLATGAAAVHELAAECDIVWLTGRPERYREPTVDWLARQGLPPGRLLMRREGDRRPARMVKVQRLRRLAAERPVAVHLDDDPAVIEAARAAGFEAVLADWAGYAAQEQGMLFRAQEQDGRA